LAVDIVASMARQRDWLTFSHLIPFPVKGCNGTQ
jgi:hypothetical protein